MASKYKDEYGRHIECTPVKSFRGNILFNSCSTMKLNPASRKDDLISLYYLIIYLITGDLPFIPNTRMSPRQAFEHIKVAKQELTAEKLCYTKESKPLI